MEVYIIIDFLILPIPTTLVSALFGSSIPFFVQLFIYVFRSLLYIVVFEKVVKRITVIRLIFVVKIFSYAENIRNFCYNEYFSDEYLEQSTCAYAVHAVFVAPRVVEGYGWTHVYQSVLKADRRSTGCDFLSDVHLSDLYVDAQYVRPTARAQTPCDTCDNKFAYGARNLHMARALAGINHVCTRLAAFGGN